MGWARQWQSSFYGEAATAALVPSLALGPQSPMNSLLNAPCPPLPAGGRLLTAPCHRPGDDFQAYWGKFFTTHCPDLEERIPGVARYVVKFTKSPLEH